MTDQAIDLEGVGISPHHLEQYFGLWEMDMGIFGPLVAEVRAMDLAAHVLKNQVQGWKPVNHSRDILSEDRGHFVGGESGFFLTNEGVAIISLVGTMTKHGTSLSSSSGTLSLRRSFRRARMSTDVKASLFKAESGGGTVLGVSDFADEVAAFAAVKPVHAFIEDLGASAAFHVASQANQVFANRTARVGSIGTFGVLVDSSKSAEKKGIEVFVVKAGEFKGVGEPGTKITEDQMAEMQDFVNEANDHFLEAVAKGRGMARSVVEALADGRHHDAKDAQALGLIDGISTFEDVLRGLAPNPAPRAGTSTRRRPIMADEQNASENVAQEGELLQAPAIPAVSAAPPEEIESTCKGASPQFVLDQIKNKSTMSQVKDAWIVEQSAQLEAQKKETEDAKAEIGRPGIEALGDGKKVAPAALAVDASDPVAAFDASVAAAMETSSLSKKDAISKVVDEDPDLHEAYMAANVRSVKKRRRGRG